MYADALLHPAWNAEEFPRVMNDFTVARPQAENDPWQRTVRILDEEFFAGHPYAASWDGAGGSLESIMLQDLQSYYEKAFVSDRMVLVAVGDFQPARLLKTLNSSFGKLAKEEKGVFVPIAEALPFYKLQSVTRFYSGQQTNISVASQIASSIVYWGDCRDYLLMMGRISRVTAEDVLAAARRYLKDAPALWIALGDTKVLKDVKREDFTGSKTR